MISEQFQSSFRAVSEQFQSSFRAISEQFQSSFRATSEQFQSSFRAVSEQLQSNFRAVSEQFQNSFRAVSEQFQSSFFNGKSCNPNRDWTWLRKVGYQHMFSVGLSRCPPGFFFFTFLTGITIVSIRQRWVTTQDPMRSFRINILITNKQTIVETWKRSRGKR